jgi:hypothetical protein
VLSYKTNNASSGNLAWTSFTGGPYILYMVVSDDNPFDTASFGTVSSYSISTEVAAWERWITLGLLLIFFLMI